MAITGRDRGRLSEAAQSLGVFPIHADVTKEDDVERTYRELMAEFGDLDILVNNAGFGVFKSLVDSDRASFDAVFATNVTGAMLMAREAAKHFIARQRGNIVNISSTAGLRGAPNGTAYYASKFALRGMTECWRAELRRYNIRVFLINPSEVLTSFASSAGLAQKENRDQAALRRDRLHREGGAGNGRSRFHARAVRLCHESQRLATVSGDGTQRPHFDNHDLSGPIDCRCEGQSEDSFREDDDSGNGRTLATLAEALGKDSPAPRDVS